MMLDKATLATAGISSGNLNVEVPMLIFQANNATEGHMRFVFAESVVTCPLADDATFQDIALTVRSLSKKGHGELVSIVVVLKPDEDDSARSLPNHISLELEPGPERLLSR